MSERHTVYLGLGSNLGDRQANLDQARRLLSPQVEIVSASWIYETDPWGFEDQPAFLNQVLAGRTNLTPAELLDLAKSTEGQMGRQPSFRYGPRLIDIDVLIYDQLQLEDERLTLPHPRLTQRAFVLIPLAQLAPDLLIPGTGKTAAECAGRIEGDQGVRPWPPEGDHA
jgi:2-amino-4-hydroxy-6-hydroxymethyldihydropteridine diphosphokinase